MSPILLYALSVAVYLKYPLIFLGTSIGGPALILTSGVLVHEGVLDIVPLFLAVCLGELTLDVVWYWLGRTKADAVINNAGKYVNITPEVYEKVKKLFFKYDALVLFVSKIAMGFGFIIAILIVAGASKIPFWKYMFWNALGEVIWVSVVLAIGYYFGELTSSLSVGFKYFATAGFVVFVVAILFGVGGALRKRYF
jgi:membrane protein DedA with SNARE-associated domain